MNKNSNIAYQYCYISKDVDSCNFTKVIVEYVTCNKAMIHGC